MSLQSSLSRRMLPQVFSFPMAAVGPMGPISAAGHPQWLGRLNAARMLKRIDISRPRCTSQHHSICTFFCTPDIRPVILYFFSLRLGRSGSSLGLYFCGRRVALTAETYYLAYVSPGTAWTRRLAYDSGRKGTEINISEAQCDVVRLMPHAMSSMASLKEPKDCFCFWSMQLGDCLPRFRATELSSCDSASILLAVLGAHKTHAANPQDVRLIHTIFNSGPPPCPVQSRICIGGT